jgi:hypothetical protein
MNILAVVRSLGDISHANIGLNNFLAFRYKHYPLNAADTLLGIWVDPQMSAAAPDFLMDDNKATHQHLDIRETAGVLGIWTICWLESEDPKDGHEVSRLTILDSLLGRARQRRQESSLGCFIPVFPSYVPRSELIVDMALLAVQNSQCLMSPWCQDLATGLLTPLDVDEIAQQGT